MRKKKSEILEAVHDTTKGLHRAGVMDLVTLREFDRLCLPLIKPLAPEKIDLLRSQTALNYKFLLSETLRERANSSSSLFAKRLEEKRTARYLVR
ncbi:hypothetical protein [Chamaesiphon minutus]|uniref:Uncharacterized protein n=1 Tax=Chamaesiphon minutus (strain ATCC 27169 / PCC 6605) TaxID=1173020 RepID=K9UE80_CHAP6|nr:hypothetical protein [Chamaesiphon minutus]AFY92509.1 hypothetical protein Cha6605_1315 [Chamaesiphon minutus PCC 6605]